MEIGSPKPPLPVVQATPQRVEASSVGVSTELPPAAAVQPVSEAVRVDTDPTSRRGAAIDAALREVIERHIKVDPKTRTVVYQAVDPGTGEVVRQLPDDAILRLKAYFREMQDKEAKREAPPQVSRIA